VSTKSVMGITATGRPCDLKQLRQLPLDSALSIRKSGKISASRLDQIKDLDFRFLGLPLDELFGIGFSMNRRRAATSFVGVLEKREAIFSAVASQTREVTVV
jgi:hypothetical protein